jgi:hypothetical protein
MNAVFIGNHRTEPVGQTIKLFCSAVMSLDTPDVKPGISVVFLMYCPPHEGQGNALN